MLKQRRFDGLKRIVVKVGTSVLTAGGDNLRPEIINGIAAQVSVLLKKGIKTVLVTSGALGPGMGLLNLKPRPATLPGKQAAAAIGQNQLMKLYDDAFRPSCYLTAQVLLTRED